MKTSALTSLALAILIGGAIAACSTPAASLVPSDLASQAASALPSLGEDVTAALDELETAIDANVNEEGLTADDQATLQGLVDSIRDDVQAGDLEGASATAEDLATELASLADKLATDNGAQLTEAFDDLRAALGM
jgi:hypothetical protein